MKYAKMGHAIIRVENLKDELRLISELRKLGQPFRMISKTDYVLSQRQIAVLKRKKNTLYMC